MRRIKRPIVHPDFDIAADASRSSVATFVTKGVKPDFPGLWSRFKDLFMEAQAGKCGFCEGIVMGLQYGDIEHFQPKAEIHELSGNPDHWGQEKMWTSTVEHRKTDIVCKPGYWWRAYHWHNYLLSCQICNQQWKKNLYPVKGRRVVLPSTDGPEEPLLLSPFDDDFDPAEHFEYGRLGDIRGLSDKGRATILTCGLDRPSLRLARYKKARATHEHLDEIAADVTERDVLRSLRCIARDGETREAYCGMVQTIFEHRTGLNWRDLSPLITRLERSNTPFRSLCDC